MNLALTVPHAILTPLLLDKGLSLSQILLVQAGFSIAVLLFEFPSGSIADMISRRTLYFISRLVFCAFFLLVIFGHGFPLMLLAWIIYGLATALESGTLDAGRAQQARWVRRIRKAPRAPLRRIMLNHAFPGWCARKGKVRTSA